MSRRDIVDAVVDIALGLLGIVALAGVAAVVLSLCSCAPPPQNALERAVASAGTAGWEAAGLPEPDRGCHIDWFQIEQHTTLETYERRCPARSYACQRWLLHAPRVRSVRYPVAIIAPAVREERRPAAALHELEHALSSCSLRTSDRGHVDPRVWEHGGPDSAEARGELLLYKPPERAPAGAGPAD